MTPPALLPCLYCNQPTETDDSPCKACGKASPHGQRCRICGINGWPEKMVPIKTPRWGVFHYHPGCLESLFQAPATPETCRSCGTLLAVPTGDWKALAELGMLPCPTCHESYPLHRESCYECQ